MINILPEHLEVIHNILQRHVPCCEVRVFGSRITDTAKKYSDLDLTLVGKDKLSDDILYSLKEDFQESDIPFRVEVLDWHAISKEFQCVIEKKYEILQEPDRKSDS
jgi:predicted nucleotidyltransferase